MFVSRFHKFIRAIWAIALLCVQAGIASATTFHVSPSGSNTPPYDTYAKAAHKVADAVLAASGYGDTVLVHAGSYDFDTTIYIPAGLTWVGVGRDSVVLNWVDTQSRYGELARAGGDNCITGLEFNYPMGSSFNQAVQGVLTIAQGTLKIHACRFRQLTASIGRGELEADSNEFLFGWTSGLYLSNGRSWIHDNHFWGASSGEGVMCLMAGNVLIEHNVFSNDAPKSLPIGVSIFKATSVVVRNNLILNSEQPVSWFYASGVVENNTMIVASGLSGGDPPRTVIPAYLRSYETLAIRNNIMEDFLGLFEFGPAYSACCDTTGLITFVHNAFSPPIDSFYTIAPIAQTWRVKIRDSANFVAYPMFVPDSSFRLQRHSLLIGAGDPALRNADSSRSDIGWTGGPNGQEYTYPELPPDPPAVVWDSGTAHIAWVRWSPRPEADLAGYRVYRGGTSGFWRPGLEPLGSFAPGVCQMADTLPAGADVAYYVITALDSAGLESGPSPESVFPNAPPAPPDSMWGDVWLEQQGNVITLHWAADPSVDLAGYRVYRGGQPGFWRPGMAPVRQVTGAWTKAKDTLSFDLALQYYVVTAFDSAGAESGPSAEWVFHDWVPLSPDSVRGSVSGRVVTLHWHPRWATEIAVYRVYRGDSSGFWQPGQTAWRQVPVGTTEVSDTLPLAVCRESYVVTTVSRSGLESGASTEWSYGDGVPRPPDSVWASRQGRAVTVEWRPAGAAGYVVYRRCDPECSPPGWQPLRRTDSGTVRITDTVPAWMMTAHYAVAVCDRVGAEGCLSAETAVSLVETPLPRTPGIMRTYPNPSNASVVIEVGIPAAVGAATPMEVVVYDALGRRVVTAYRGVLSPGVYQIPWDAVDPSGKALTSGVYFVRLEAGQHVFGKSAKVVVVR